MLYHDVSTVHDISCNEQEILLPPVTSKSGAVSIYRSARFNYKTALVYGT